LDKVERVEISRYQKDKKWHRKQENSIEAKKLDSRNEKKIE
jgi:hypothetical protein